MANASAFQLSLHILNSSNSSHILYEKYLCAISSLLPQVSGSICLLYNSLNASEAFFSICFSCNLVSLLPSPSVRKPVFLLMDWAELEYDGAAKKSLQSWRVQKGTSSNSSWYISFQYSSARVEDMFGSQITLNGCVKHQQWLMQCPVKLVLKRTQHEMM